MKVTRLDLDGTGSPEGLVTKILKAEPDLTYPVPIEELAAALDIKEIAVLETAGFEGSLLMDQYRTKGIILVSKDARSGRRRFTIGHELGHFLIPTHKPVKGDAFLCSRDDMRLWSTAEQNAYARMEVEANKFSALMLMPPPLLRPYLARTGDPDLKHVLALHDDFEVSKDSAARAYAQFHEEPIALAVVHEGKVQRIYKGLKFPRLSVAEGDAVPHLSIYWRRPAGGDDLSGLVETQAGQWLQFDWGKPLPALFEQVLHQQRGYALILLWPELAEEDEDADLDENRTSKQRLSERMATSRWRNWSGADMPICTAYPITISAHAKSSSLPRRPRPAPTDGMRARPACPAGCRHH
ncbi:ImmA/IrrE family metallo-endopeptidase [Dongia sp.]|uniref:ImmA/IrrE family metallo-endopeptidase n=1 Tax=Dongia sp. TaxID=1977262 RepID=UPI0035B05AD8